MKVLKLRPHHINCIFFYEGKGYSEAFVQNMDELVARLRNNPGQLVVFQKANDILCNHCPNQRGGQCIESDKIEALDKNTLLTHNIEEHKIYAFNTIIEKIYIDYDSDSFQAVCKHCEWYKQGVCNKEKIKERENTWTYK